MGAAIIAALASILVAGISYASNRNLMDKQQDYNKEQLEQQNEYNTPSAQMERLKDAGVNPSTLAMNGGQSVMNQSASPLPFSPIPTDFGNVGDMMSQFSNSSLQFAQAKTENRMREVRYQNALKENKEMDARIRGLNASSQAQEIANQYAHAREIWSLRTDKSVVYMNFQQSAVYQHQVKRFQYELDHILPADLYKIISETNVNIMSLDEMTAVIADYYSKISEREQNISESQSRQGLIEAQTGLTEQQTQTEVHETGIKAVEEENAQTITDKVIEQYNKTIDNIAEQTKKTKEEVFWYSFDEADKLGSWSLVGSKLPYNRFRSKKIRDKFEKTLENRLREHVTVYYPK